MLTVGAYWCIDLHRYIDLMMNGLIASIQKENTDQTSIPVTLINMLSSGCGSLFLLKEQVVIYLFRSKSVKMWNHILVTYCNLIWNKAIVFNQQMIWIHVSFVLFSPKMKNVLFLWLLILGSWQKKAHKTKFDLNI